MRRRLHLCAAGLAAVVMLAAFAGPASAGPLVASAGSCDDESLSKPFTPWLDHADYTLLPRGTFERGTDGWSLSGGGIVANGNSPYYVSGEHDHKSLTLPGGAVATSPAMCVGLEHPTLRFFAKRTSGGLLSLSLLKVDVLFEDALGIVNEAPLGTIGSDGSWQPTAPIAVVANLLPLLPGDHTPVAFRFTPVGGDWAIDDVYVDPYSRH